MVRTAIIVRRETRRSDYPPPSPAATAAPWTACAGNHSPRIPTPPAERGRVGNSAAAAAAPWRTFPERQPPWRGRRPWARRRERRAQRRRRGRRGRCRSRWRRWWRARRGGGATRSSRRRSGGRARAWAGKCARRRAVACGCGGRGRLPWCGGPWWRVSWRRRVTVARWVETRCWWRWWRWRRVGFRNCCVGQLVRSL